MALKLNIRLFEELFESFYTLTKLKIVVFDTDYNEIFAYPEESGAICTLMHSNKTGESACFESNRVFCRKCAEIRGLYIGKCYAGLTEAVIPILKDSIIIGYIMFGQTGSNKEKISESVKEALKNNGITDFSIESLTEKLNCKTDAELKAASVILKACSDYVQMKDMAALDKKELISEIIGYINENLAEDLSVAALCKHFYISRSKLYQITESYMKEGVASYIKDIRLEKACRRLLTADYTSAKIAEVTGFKDYNYFNRVFKEKYGLSIREFKSQADIRK